MANEYREIIIKEIPIASLEESLCKEYEELWHEKIEAYINRIITGRIGKELDTKEEFDNLTQTLKKSYYTDFAGYAKQAINNRVKFGRELKNAGITEDECKCKDCGYFCKSDGSGSSCGFDPYPVVGPEESGCVMWYLSKRKKMQQ